MIPDEAAMTAAEKAVRDIGAAVEGWPGNGRSDVDVILEISRIV